MSYIGKAPGVGVRNRYYFTATGGETSLSGPDDSGNTLAFTDGKYVDVILNGITLVAGTDYNTATTNTISGLAALSASDIVEIVVYDVFSIAAAVPPTGGTFTGLVQFNDQIIIPRGTTAQRPPSPVAGSVRFNTSASAYEGYDGTAWVYLSDVYVAIQYIVIAGGGAGGGKTGGGGGAGGYRSSISGESSGGGVSAESPQTVTAGVTYTITVGAGGSGVANAAGNNGSASRFADVSTVGGGGGGSNAGPNYAGLAGGSGGGSTGNTTGASVPGGAGTANEGFAGGATTNWSGTYPAGGGGGAGAAGQTVGGSGNGGTGGNGVQSSVTGSAVYRAGGGGGGVYTSASGGTGGLGGGGNGTQSGTPTAGAANTGGGGGGEGANDTANPGGAGGSGVIILKVPAGFSASFSAGVSQTSTTVGTDTVYTITAAGASDTVTFS